ncbi:hypothetical protein [Phyllobacterium sp. YR531]|uniref:hypothetical protein n=1 Tax=Phyllobacterium sp. YR531 TaxID=1144343 RepID=UPI00026FA9CD|nr:hypothetical protein [Phyllobacterium sp. YR531]EJN04179.1 hypothetical protein PMI41_01818 [Phyllobacterium sp. YR531]
MNETDRSYEDEADQLIAEHEGDANAAIARLIEERSFLTKELEYASLAMGFGFARGWKPKLLKPRH